jgi:hypothetical protein
MAPDGAPPGKFRCGCQRWSNSVRQSGIEDGIAIRASRHGTATRTTPGLTTSAGIRKILCAASWRTVRLRRWLTITGILRPAGGGTLRLRRGLAITSILGRGTLRLRRTLAITSRGCSTGAVGPRAGIPTVGRRPDRRDRRQLAGGHKASSSDGTDRGSRRIAFEPPPHPATAVINTAGDTNAGGRHPDADMEGIGRLLGHRHPSGGLHLHHYKQQFFSLNKKFLSSQAREGCAMVYHNNFGFIFFKSGSAKIHQTHQSIFTSINFVRTINLVRPWSKILQNHSKNSFQTLDSLFNFWIRSKKFQSWSRIRLRVDSGSTKCRVVVPVLKINYDTGIKTKIRYRY